MAFFHGVKNSCYSNGINSQKITCPSCKANFELVFVENDVKKEELLLSDGSYTIYVENSTIVWETTQDICMDDYDVDNLKLVSVYKGNIHRIAIVLFTYAIYEHNTLINKQLNRYTFKIVRFL
jgi:uncharacterized protein YbaR (Trm112 family)